MVGLCNVWLCGELCGRAVYYVLMCGLWCRAVYCAVWWCTV